MTKAGVLHSKAQIELDRKHFSGASSDAYPEQLHVRLPLNEKAPSGALTYAGSDFLNLFLIPYFFSYKYSLFSSRRIIHHHPPHPIIKVQIWPFISSIRSCTHMYGSALISTHWKPRRSLEEKITSNWVSPIATTQKMQSKKIGISHASRF